MEGWFKFIKGSIICSYNFLNAPSFNRWYNFQRRNKVFPQLLFIVVPFYFHNLPSYFPPLKKRPNVYGYY